jgi:hypothetical protein
MTVKEMGAAWRMLGGLLALSQNRDYGKSARRCRINRSYGKPKSLSETVCLTRIQIIAVAR